jgi:hypothetical protein
MTLVGNWVKGLIYGVMGVTFYCLLPFLVLIVLIVGLITAPLYRWERTFGPFLDLLCSLVGTMELVGDQMFRRAAEGLDRVRGISSSRK